MAAACRLRFVTPWARGARHSASASVATRTRTRLARLALASVTAAACLTARPVDARAEDRTEKAVCLDAMSKGQTLRDTHKLLEARDRFRVCSRQVCPTLVQNDCGGWLADVERSLPTVVLSARSSAGGDLFATKVSMDGQTLEATLDGQAIAVNPGLHTFHFESDGMKPADRQALVKEGGKAQSIVGVLEPVAAPVATVTTVKTPTASSSGSGLRTAGFIIGGVGVAGLIVGTIEGVLATSSKSSNCPTNNLCLHAGDASSIQSQALVSTIGFVAGGVLTATGLGFVLFAPRSTAAHPETALRLVPTFTSGTNGTSGAGLGIGSSF